MLLAMIERLEPNLNLQVCQYNPKQLVPRRELLHIDIPDKA
jgi:hypothetical protein